MENTFCVKVFEDSFGFATESTVMGNVNKATAKSVARHYNKITRNMDFIFYHAAAIEDEG